MSKVRNAAQTSVSAGHLLPEDATTIIAAAQDSGIGG
ncbi:hypothetical protein [Streptomyces sp. NPDC050422]